MPKTTLNGSTNCHEDGYWERQREGKGSPDARKQEEEPSPGNSSSALKPSDEPMKSLPASPQPRARTTGSR